MANNATQQATPMNSGVLRLVLCSMLLAISLSFLFACGGDDSGGNGGSQGSNNTPSSDNNGNNNLSSSSIVGGNGLCTGFANGTAREHYGKQKKQFCDERDGNKYVYVEIGTQTWMAENLNYDVPNDATDLCYNSDNTNCATYGRLYRWNAAKNGSASSNTVPSGVQGICPSGWHLPSNAEWEMLTVTVGGTVNDYLEFKVTGAATPLKAASGWNSGGNGTDIHGFSALPGGDRSSGFENLGISGFWWSATDIQSYGSAWRMVENSGDAYRKSYDNNALFSIRCIKDYAGTCGDREYDVETQFCSGNTIYSKCNSKEYDIATQFCSSNTVYSKCGGIEYDPATKFCSGTTILDRCGGTGVTYNPSIEQCCGSSKITTATQFCSANKVYSKCGVTGGTQVEYNPSTEQCCNNSKITIATQFCLDNTIYNKCNGKEYDIATQFCTKGVLKNYGSLNDSRNSTTYKTAVIGTLTWMAENLNYNVGTNVCARSSSGCSTYGRLYRWNTALTACPSGWRLPSDDEWGALITEAVTSFALRAASGWSSGYNGTNDYGFSALPGGYYTSAGSYNGSDAAYWWTATSSSSGAYYRHMPGASSALNRANGITSTDYYSVRCVQDGSSTPSSSSVSTSSSSGGGGAGDFCNYGTCVGGSGWSCTSGGCYRMPVDDNCVNGTLVSTCPAGTKPPSADY